MSGALATWWRSAPGLRVAVGALVAADTLSLAVAPSLRGAPSLLVAALDFRPVRPALVTLGVAAAVHFVAGAGRWRAGFVALAALALLSTAHADVAGGPARNLYFSGVALLGWIAGTIYRRGDERFAATGAVALLGATYFSAGLSKLAYSGAPWLNGLQIQAMILSQDGLVSDGPLAPLRQAVLGAPWLARGLTGATVLIELAGPLLLGPKVLRRGVAFGLLAMHVAIFLMGGISYLSSAILLLVVALARPQVASVVEPAPPPRWLTPLTWACMALAALAVAHQAGRATPTQVDAALDDPTR